jgi:hypothetical protein
MADHVHIADSEAIEELGCIRRQEVKEYSRSGLDDLLKPI